MPQTSHIFGLFSDHVFNIKFWSTFKCFEKWTFIHFLFSMQSLVRMCQTPIIFIQDHLRSESVNCLYSFFKEFIPIEVSESKKILNIRIQFYVMVPSYFRSSYPGYNLFYLKKRVTCMTQLILTFWMYSWATVFYINQSDVPQLNLSLGVRIQSIIPSVQSVRETLALNV